MRTNLFHPKGRVLRCGQILVETYCYESFEVNGKLLLESFDLTVGLSSGLAEYENTQ